MPKTMFDKIWDTHEVADGLIYIDLHLVHEVTSPQAFDGLRMEGRRRPVADPGRDARAQLRRVRHPALLARLGPPGHRPRDRTRAGHHAAWPDDRLRRQPHLDARRLRRAGVRNRHLGGRARPRNAVPGPAPAEDDAD